MDKFSQASPRIADDRRNSIATVAREAGYHDDPYLNNLNLTVILFFVFKKFNIFSDNLFEHSSVSSMGKTAGNKTV